MRKFRFKWFLFSCLATIFLLFNSNLFAAGLYLSEVASPGTKRDEIELDTDRRGLLPPLPFLRTRQAALRQDLDPG